ncbi:MAG: DUF362 domain-containing protein [Chloroflexota bacterium]|nr:DUF362 domain-containing protein [Chloroflexota bacterium]
MMRNDQRPSSDHKSPIKNPISNLQSPTSGIRLSRRAFLRLALLGGIGAGAAVIYKQTEFVGFDNWFRWMVRGNAARIFGGRSRVALAACASYEADVLAALRRVWQDAQAPDLRGARIVLKPNLVDFVDGFPSFTDPRVAQAMIRFAREMGARAIVVADGPTFRRDPQAILNATGYTEMLAREQVPFVDLNYDDLVTIPLKGGYTKLKTLFVARTIRDADLFVSMPKLKTHHWTQISVSVKNLFGIVPGVKYGWPKNTLHIQGVAPFLAELADSLPTRGCAVVDGIVGMEGDGPLFGHAVASGVLAVGTDLLAVDATCARVMGFNPASIDYLNFAAWAGVGAIDESKIDLVGEPLAKLQRAFERPPQL